VETISTIGPWLNVSSSDFRLHLRRDVITSAFIVRKPTKDGDVHSLELFDHEGFCFAQVFGARKPGNPELYGWRTIISEL
jgi:putative hemin transport protein